jgi:PAS domain S-box-containing protein
MALTSVLLTFILIERTVLSRLHRLSDGMQAVGSSTDARAGCPTGRRVVGPGPQRQCHASVAEEAQRVQQESEARYRALVQLSPDAILVTSRGQILFSNTGAERLFQAEPGGLLGTALRDRIHPDSRELLQAHLGGIDPQFTLSPSITIYPGMSRTVEAQILTIQGRVVDVELVSVVISTWVPSGAAIVRDVTERKRVTELQKAKEAAERQRPKSSFWPAWATSCAAAQRDHQLQRDAGGRARRGQDAIVSDHRSRPPGATSR